MATWGGTSLKDKVRKPRRRKRPQPPLPPPDPQDIITPGATELAERALACPVCGDDLRVRPHLHDNVWYRVGDDGDQVFASGKPYVPVDEGRVAPQAHAPDEALPDPATEASESEVEEVSRPRVEDAPVSRTVAPVRMRLQSVVPEADFIHAKGKIVTDDYFNVVLKGPSIVQKPQGGLLLVYLPGVLTDVMDEVYPVLTTIRMLTDNRGLASGSHRVKAGTTRTRTKQVMSGVLGSMDPVGPMQYCRLTAYTAKNVDKWESLLPLWQAIAAQFREHVPSRYQRQMEFVEATPPEWVIAGTPFTTITINNSYPTGVHTDSGDLDEGFSCLAVARRGEYTGGILSFPQYSIGVDMQHGDLVLMDAHEYHGNTRLVCSCGTSETMDRGPCKTCHAERISVVCYYRTAMTRCGSLDEEYEKKARYGARRLDEGAEMDADLAAVTTTLRREPR